MPLDPPSLINDLTNLTTNPPPDPAGCATAWAQAMGDYAKAIVPPSSALPAALVKFQADMAAAFVITAGAVAEVELAFTTLGAAVAAGMLLPSPPPGIVGATPPPPPVGFVNLFAQGNPATAQQGASGVAGIVDTWMRKGTVIPATGSPINWQ
jgi:hypothetical protein